MTAGGGWPRGRRGCPRDREGSTQGCGVRKERRGGKRCADSEQGPFFARHRRGPQASLREGRCQQAIALQGVMLGVLCALALRASV